MSDLTWSTLLQFGTHTKLALTNLIRIFKSFALRMCTRNWNQEYDVLLNFYGIPTLAGRRKQLKLCSLFQMMNGQIPFPNTPPVRRPALNLRNSYPHLVQPAVCSSAHQLSFFPHAISLWNQIPNSVYDCGPLIQALYTFSILVDVGCICSFIFVISFVLLSLILYRLGT